MHSIAVLGAGNVGCLITCLLMNTGDYQVHLIDSDFSGNDFVRLEKLFPTLSKTELDVLNESEFSAFIKEFNCDAIISCLPYFCNPTVAKLARQHNLHYFDLTEDIEVSNEVKRIAAGAEKVFISQCGLAPGFVSMVASNLINEFERVDTVNMRVGALPSEINNSLQYALTWSVDGIINQYGNPGLAIVDSKVITTKPLRDLETIELDGERYEAFNTSGGLGNMIELFQGKVMYMNYKSIRYPGHCEKMRLLMNDLKLNQDRETLKKILKNALPKTYNDVVIIYVLVRGYLNDQYLEKNYIKKVYPQEISGFMWSAIQVTTAAGICSVVDTVLQNQEKYHGFVCQENFNLNEIIANRFGQYYQS